MDHKNWEEIKEEVNNEMELKAKNMKNDISNLLENIGKFTDELYKKGQTIIFNFTENRIKPEDIPEFKDYFSQKVTKNGYSGYNILNEIHDEITDCIKYSKSKIWEKKNIFDFLFSLVNDSSYLKNLIDIIKDAFQSKTNNIFELIIKNIGEYISEMLENLSPILDAISKDYTKEQEGEWQKLIKEFKQAKTIINESLKKLCI